MKRVPFALCALSLLSATAYAAAPDTEAVEFYNELNGHFFVTASALEASLIDAGSAGAGWMRTGRTFQAWLSAANAPAEAQPVCRFYSSGANSHFYTASGSECTQLQALAASEKAATGQVRGWQYEGVAFYIQVPQSGQCAAGTTTLTRVYNNGFATGAGSNHRFVDDAALQALMVDRAWIAESAAMCAASKSTGTEANLPATTTSFDAIAGTWNGSAHWEQEAAGRETETTAPLTLTIGTDGAITGSGDGCTFTGQVSTGDGFRSFFRGTATAAGCTDAAFNGDYSRLRLERFDHGRLLVHLKREDATSEVSISARLTQDAGTAPPPPPTAGPAGVAGDWVGTVGWEAHATGQAEVEVNKPLTLGISSSGAISGSGFGCTLTGTLSTTTGEDHGAGGSITASGCDNALFNGTYDHVEIRRTDRGLKIEMGRQSSGAEVQIEGTLVAKPAA